MAATSPVRRLVRLHRIYTQDVRRKFFVVNCLWRSDGFGYRRDQIRLTAFPRPVKVQQ